MAFDVRAPVDPMKSNDENVGDATMGIARFAAVLLVTGLITGVLGSATGSLWGWLWERRHRRRNPRVKPEAGADGASGTAAKPADTVAADELRMEDGVTHALVLGTLFHVPARPHDTGVVGDVPFTALLFVGAERLLPAVPS